MLELLNLIKQTKDYVDSSKLEILNLINQTMEYVDLTNKRIDLIQEFLVTIGYDKFLKSRSAATQNERRTSRIPEDV